MNQAFYIEILKKKIKRLEQQLNNTKIFLNMVIHDMRNPTNAMEYAIKEVINLLEKAKERALKKAQSFQNVF